MNEIPDGRTRQVFHLQAPHKACRDRLILTPLFLQRPGQHFDCFSILPCSLEMSLIMLRVLALEIAVADCLGQMSTSGSADALILLLQSTVGINLHDEVPFVLVVKGWTRML